MLLFAKVLWKTERNRIEAVRPYLVKSLSELRLLSGGVWKTRLEPVIIGSSRRSYRGPCPKELWCTRGARDFRPSAEFSQPPVEHVSFRFVRSDYIWFVATVLVGTSPRILPAVAFDVFATRTGRRTDQHRSRKRVIAGESL